MARRKNRNLPEDCTVRLSYQLTMVPGKKINSIIKNSALSLFVEVTGQKSNLLLNECSKHKGGAKTRCGAGSKLKTITVTNFIYVQLQVIPQQNWYNTLLLIERRINAFRSSRFLVIFIFPKADFFLFSKVTNTIFEIITWTGDNKIIIKWGMAIQSGIQNWSRA